MGRGGEWGWVVGAGGGLDLIDSFAYDRHNYSQSVSCFK